MVKDYREILQNKEEATFYIPINLNRGKLELFTIELLDCLEGYLFPIQYGINKCDIIDFIDSKFTDFMEFLIYKRYIAVENDFIDLIKKYSDNKDVCSCYKIKIINTLSMDNELIRKLVYRVVDAIQNSNTIISEQTISQKGMFNFDNFTFLEM